MMKFLVFSVMTIFILLVPLAINNEVFASHEPQSDWDRRGFTGNILYYGILVGIPVLIIGIIIGVIFKIKRKRRNQRKELQRDRDIQNLKDKIDKLEKDKKKKD